MNNFFDKVWLVFAFCGFLLGLLMAWVVILACLIYLFPEGNKSYLFWGSIAIVGGAVVLGIYSAIREELRRGY